MWIKFTNMNGEKSIINAGIIAVFIASHGMTGYGIEAYKAYGDSDECIPLTQYNLTKLQADFTISMIFKAIEDGKPTFNLARFVEDGESQPEDEDSGEF